jgi:hypothetical protein
MLAPSHPRGVCASRLKSRHDLPYRQRNFDTTMNHSRLSRQPLTDVQAAVVRLHDEAQLSFEQIGRQSDVTRTRVRQIYFEAHARLRDFNANGYTAICLLPGRARSVLKSCGLTSWAETRAAMEAGHLQAQQGGHLVFWRKQLLWSVSRKTWSVLYEWAGRPVLPPCDWHSLYRPPAQIWFSSLRSFSVGRRSLRYRHLGPHSAP